MLSITHATTGSFIAVKIPNLLISLPLIIAAHYAEDYIPHWDIGQGLSKQKKSKKTAFLQELFIDLPLSIILVFFFFQFNQPFNPLIWLGLIFGLLPDFIEFPRLFLKWRFTPIRQLNAFHKYFHNSIPHKIRGLIPQLLIILLIYILR